jgi:hypothetical protein
MGRHEDFVRRGQLCLTWRCGLTIHWSGPCRHRGLMPAVPQRFCTAVTARLSSLRPLNSIVRRQLKIGAQHRVAFLPRTPLCSYFEASFKFFFAGYGYLAPHGVSRDSVLPAPDHRAGIHCCAEACVQTRRPADPGARPVGVGAGSTATLRSIESLAQPNSRRLTTHWSGQVWPRCRSWPPRGSMAASRGRLSRQAAQFDR